MSRVMTRPTSAAARDRCATDAQAATRPQRAHAAR